MSAESTVLPSLQIETKVSSFTAATGLCIKKTVLGGRRDPRRNSFSAFYPFYRIGIMYICISWLEYKSYNSIGLSLTNLFSRQSASFVCRLFVDELLPERLYRRLQVMRNYGMSCGSNDVWFE